jgi:hypothetical protein
MVIQCCMCKRVESNGEWTRQSEALGSLVSHTYCPPCLDKSRREFARRENIAAASSLPVTP